MSLIIKCSDCGEAYNDHLVPGALAVHHAPGCPKAELYSMIKFENGAVDIEEDVTKALAQMLGEPHERH